MSVKLKFNKLLLKSNGQPHIMTQSHFKASFFKASNTGIHSSLNLASSSLLIVSGARRGKVTGVVLLAHRVL